MLLFAGLGNPGAKYANNRHNVGFMAADAIARRHSFSPWSKKFQGRIAEGTLGGEKVLLIKPQTFMNLSGQAVGEALRFYKLDPSAPHRLLRRDRPRPGKVRVKLGGGAGGHNGIRSLDQHVGKDYRRVRIGVGHPGVKEMVHGHVLGDFAKADREWLERAARRHRRQCRTAGQGRRQRLHEPAAWRCPARQADADRPTTTAAQAARAPRRPRAISARRGRKQPAAKLPETGPMAAMLKSCSAARIDRATTRDWQHRRPALDDHRPFRP